jgi:hypothetical protein
MDSTNYGTATEAANYASTQLFLAVDRNISKQVCKLEQDRRENTWIGSTGQFGSPHEPFVGQPCH